MSSKAVSIALSALAKKRDLDGAMLLFRSSRHFNVYTYTQLIQACVNCRDMKRALDLLDEMRDKNIQPSAQTLNRILKGLKQLKRPQDLLRFFDSMSSYSVKPDAIAWNLALNASAQLRDLNRTQYYFDKMLSLGEADVVSYTILLRSYAAAGQVDVAEQVLRSMLRDGPAPDVYTWSSLVEAFAAHGQVQRALELTAEMKHLGVQPNLVTFNAIIKGYGQENKVDEAFDVFHRICQSGLQPDVVTYNSLIRACCRAGDMRRAMKTFRTLRFSGIAPTFITYNTLLKGFGRVNDLESAFEVFDEAMRMSEQQNVEETELVFTFVSLIHACVVCNDVDRALAVFHQLQESGLPMSVVPYTIVCTALIDAGRAQEAAPLLQDVEDKHLEKSMVFYNALISTLSKVGDAASAVKYYDQMVQDGYQPDAITYVTLCKGLSAADDQEPLLEVLDDMLANRRVKFDLQHFTTAAEAFVDAGLWDRVERIRNMLTESGIHPDAIFYSVLIKGYAEAGRFEEAKDVWRELQEQMLAGAVAIPPSVFTVWLKCCCAAKELDIALEALRCMHTLAITPEPAAFTVLAKALCEEHRVEDALEVWSASWRSGCEISQHSMLDLMSKSGIRNASTVVLEALLARRTQPNLPIYVSLIRASTSADEVVFLLQQAPNFFPRPSAILYEHAMEVCIALDAAPRCDHVWSYVVQQGVQPSLDMLNLHIKALLVQERLDEAAAVLLTMHEYGLRANSMTFAAFSSAMPQQEQLSTALAVLRLLLANRVPISDDCATFIRTCCVSSSDDPTLLELIGLIEEHSPRNPPLRHLLLPLLQQLLPLCIAADDVSLATEVLQHLTSCGAPLDPRVCSDLLLACTRDIKNRGPAAAKVAEVMREAQVRVDSTAVEALSAALAGDKSLASLLQPIL